MLCILFKLTASERLRQSTMMLRGIIRLFIFHVLISGAVVIVNSKSNSSIESLCGNCTIVPGNVYIKLIWFPIAPPEYKCINESSLISNYSLIVDVSCTIESCKGIVQRRPVKLWDPNDIMYYCNKSFCKYPTLFFSFRDGIDVFLIVILLVFFIKSVKSLVTQRIIDSVLGRWNNFVNNITPIL